ncbi:MAG: 4Fe-4S dicluster domain-containing protein [Desulfarculus sp.]|jgi:Pyruvate/2-oxoacid:ferredoxin oxidoreductase delta subunit|nr:MAG: 4Fe-4S dicluster domain-containing protein [Desulfarculus sp.]
MDVYQRLAQKLDQLPEGFPATGSGVELRILRQIFEPAEAEMALQMSPLPETAEAIAERLGRPVPEMRATLEDMARKGQIASFKMGGQQMYRMAPFVVGIYEFQRRERLTKELAELVEEYMPSLSQKVGGFGPHLTRVIPVNAPLKADLNILPRDDIRQIIAKAKSFRVQDCVCRREQGLLDNRCQHTLHCCLQYSMEEDAYAYFNLDGEVVSREEALRIVEAAEQEGLVHSTYNVEEAPGGFLCNCCPCCCGLLRSLKEFDSPYVLARSSYLASIDQDTCQACGLCKDERCPMDAISEEDGVYRVLAERCLGCGVCAVTCPSDSITLLARPQADRVDIAKNMIDWAQRRLAQREQGQG